jgi:predicted RNase H-like HicB family nuclease
MPKREVKLKGNTFKKREVKLKGGNTFKYVYYRKSLYEPDQSGYSAFVPIFKGCVTSTQNNSIKELEKQVKLAIKDWLEPTSLTVAERQRLEQLERLVASKDYFYKAMAENISEEWIEKGFESWYTKRCNCGNVCLCTPPTPYESMRSGFKAGIQYALKAPTEGE